MAFANSHGRRDRIRRATRRLGAAAALLAVGVTSACASPDAAPPSPPAVNTDGPTFDFLGASDGVEIRDGDDWSMPPSARPAANSGFFSEEASAEDHVFTRSVDVSWRQIQPTQGGLDRSASGEAQGLNFDSLDEQLARPDRFWMRIFASGESWAPEWVAEDCGVSTYGPDYDGERHLPIWDECVWGHLLDSYRKVFIDGGLAADPRLSFVYVPGAFTWAEFDYDIVTAAVEAGDLDLDTYLAWHDHALTDLAELFGEHATKLVFTGEDYPFGPFDTDDDLLAADAVDAGLGIRNGITEVSNFHLSEAPAYGSHILPNGHLALDDTLPVHDGTRIVATENECFNDCGYNSDDPYYAVRQSNLKALQLRTNWIYVVPDPSYFAEYPEHWDWVRLSMGATAQTSPDAWAALRDAEDTYWAGDEAGPFETGSESWANRPWVRNLERWLVQVDEPGSVAHRSDDDVHVGVVQADNGTAHEGLRTDAAGGDTGFVFELDPRFSAASEACVVKVTYLDSGTGAFTVDVGDWSSPLIERTADGAWKTATVALPSGALAEHPSFRISVTPGADDLTARFVRVVRSE
ncbi:hypothetical protein L1277_002220 [Okibacterium sp. HSC-33S16]|uniref:hypothetical protein n=1 Tax=Okibacterium sp. HSC-33S16 TaxID=2910965 RepID=UPI00209E0FF2|nr:hypothetical protein [Okibacterium sp. HSC-33S16]MCP2032121.1 hypothetical protein [Okibacterium sp. HSC-33S16]